MKTVYSFRLYEFNTEIKPYMERFNIKYEIIKSLDYCVKIRLKEYPKLYRKRCLLFENYLFINKINFKKICTSL